MRRPLTRGWRFRVCSVQVLVALAFLVLPVAATMGYHEVGGTLAGLRIGPVDLVEPTSALSAVLAGRQLTRTAVLGVLPLAVLALVLGPVFCLLLLDLPLGTDFRAPRHACATSRTARGPGAVARPTSRIPPGARLTPPSRTAEASAAIHGSARTARQAMDDAPRRSLGLDLAPGGGDDQRRR